MGMLRQQLPPKQQLSQKQLQELEDQSYAALSTLLAGKTQTYDSFRADFTLLSPPAQNPSWSIPVPPQFYLPQRIMPEPAAFAAAASPEMRRSDEDDVQVLGAGTSGGRLSLPSGVDPPSMKVDNLMADDGKQLADDPLGVQEDSDSEFESPPPLLSRRPFSARRLAAGIRLPVIAEPKESSQTMTRDIPAPIDQEPILEFSSHIQCPVKIE